MAMSDCIKCWDTPCTCGYDYKDKTEQGMVKYIFSITKYHNQESIFNELLQVSKDLQDDKLDEKLLEYGYCKGNYMNTCNDCGEMTFNVDKRCLICKFCAMKRRRKDENNE